MESIGYTRKYYEHNKDLGKYTLRKGQKSKKPSLRVSILL